MAPTRWGICSAGKISHDFTTCLRSLPDEEHVVVAVAAKNVDNANKFAELHKIPRVYPNYEDLVKDQEIDVVYVGSLNTQHYEIVKMLLEGGKPVLCEKPLTMNVKDTQELIALAQKKKLFFMEAVWSRFLPGYRRMMEELLTLGAVQYVHVSFGKAEISKADRVMKANLGGSTILDLGVYVFNLIEMVMGGEKPQSIKVLGVLNDSKVDVATSGAMKFSGDRLATFSTSAVADLPCEADIVCEKGTIKICSPVWTPTEIITPSKGKESFPNPPTVLPCNYLNSSGLRYEAMEVRRCLQQGLTESPTFPLRDSETLAYLMTEALDQLGVTHYTK